MLRVSGPLSAPSASQARAQVLCHRLTLALAVFALFAARPSAFACVVGNGTSASCTEAALHACLPGGSSFDGTVTFDCGGAATITVTSRKIISADTTIDGGGVITISGGLTHDLTCSGCGHRNPTGRKFCNGCGNRLGESARLPERDRRDYTPKHLAEKILSSRSALEGERKQVTVLFQPARKAYGQRDDRVLQRVRAA